MLVPRATLVEINGEWVIVPVMFPVLVALMSLVVRKQVVRIIAAIVMGGFRRPYTSDEGGSTPPTHDAAGIVPVWMGPKGLNQSTASNRPGLEVDCQSSAYIGVA